MSSHAIETSRATGDGGHRPYARSLLRSFGLTALLVVTLIGVVLGFALRSSIRDRAIADAARTAEVAAGVGVLPYLTVDDVDRSFAPLGPERLEEIDRVLGNSLSPNGIVRINVWNRQHWIVYSDNPNMVGRWFPESELLGRAFDGETTSEITDLTAPEEREEREFGRLLSVYVPLREAPDGDLSIDGAGELIGAFEIYLPWQPIAAQIARDSFELYAALGMGLLVLYLALFRLVAGASRTITRQGDENLRRATTDELTGLANRERFSERLGELIRERRQHRTPISLLLLDVDGFQKINDTLGHDRGDLVIQQIARRLVARMRVGDEVARLGGDEFGVILDGVTDGETHRSVADRLLQVLEEPIEVDGIQLDVRCSVGLSRWPEDGDSAAELLRRADIAMNAAKRDETTIAEYAADLDHYSPDALELVGDVRSGIRNDEFWLVYQPQFALDTGEVIGAEALVRWTHPTRGFVPPGAFIPALETLPACRELTDHVLALAIDQLAAWHDDDLPVTMSVNLSARDASDPDLPRVVDRLLAAHGVDPRFLHLELTEGTALARPVRTRSVLAELRALGCGVAIDDFGTGFASLSYLTSLPITELKIDRSFVAGLNRNTTDTAIVRHGIDLGHSLGLTVVAEGIEEPETLAALRALGCDVAQGFFLAKPAPAAEVDLTARHPVGANVPAPDDPDHGDVPS